MAIWGPVPPRLFREDTIAPMKTRIKMVKGDVYRVYFSTSYTSIPVEPRCTKGINVVIQFVEGHPIVLAVVTFEFFWSNDQCGIQ